MKSDQLYQFYKSLKDTTDKLLQKMKGFVKGFISDDVSFIASREEAKYWKNRIYYITAGIMLVFGGPLMFLGAYVFLRTGKPLEAGLELSFYLISVVVLSNKRLKYKIKKLYIVYALYQVSIFLLGSAGNLGAGMVCVVFTLVLSGCLLERNQIIFFIMTNILVFVLLTICLYTGWFDAFAIATYKPVWMINVLTVQTCGIILLVLMYKIYTGLERQAQKIKNLNRHDTLTGLYNRAFFEAEQKRLDKPEYLPLSIIVGDINGLKIINDSLGHAEGDKLLITIANMIKACTRSTDIVARISGDEFNILLPRTDYEEAQEIISRIHSECDSYNKNVASDLYHISISLGAATKIVEKESLDIVQKIAEDFMYKRKLLEGRSFHSSIISSMKMALFEKSYETEQHAMRLIHLTREVGRAIGLSKSQFDELELFSTLHDIGKIGIDSQILNKPSGLTDGEWVKMRKHSEIGYRIAMASPELMSIAYYILTHHEHWDGNGYPQGLAGDNIPLLSRILSLADAYDAMTEDRPYRKGMSKQSAIEEIRRNSGTQFDPKLAEIFINILSQNDEIGFDTIIVK